MSETKIREWKHRFQYSWCSDCVGKFEPVSGQLPELRGPNERSHIPPDYVGSPNGYSRR